jgi:Bacterial TSP3 repeat
MGKSQRLIAAMMGIGLSGCLYGTVDDAVTGSAIQDVTVKVVKGICSGSGCTSPNIQLTDSGGMYVFDAYGNYHGDAEVQLITPASGEEAVQFSLSKPGYTTVNLYHRPKYQTVTDNSGNSYLVSSVQQIFLCPVGALDSDGDGICDAAEARYGTNPFNPDTDGDRLSDLAELYGYAGVDLRYFGAKPTHKDVFIEADYYPNRKPTATGIQRVVDAFAAAPVSNPDGTTGIALHVDLDQQIATADAKSDLNPVWTDFDVIKAKYFPARRAPFFHYAVFANTYSGGTSSGISRGIPAHDFVVTLGGWSPAGGTELEQAGTLMHEFGHNLGLHHGGNEDVPNYKANYFSVMNYSYQVVGLRVSGVTEVLDYSRLRVGGISESAISESSAFSALAPTTEGDLAKYGVLINGLWKTGTASASLDVNGNGVINAGTIAFDLDNDGDSSDTLNPSQIDWSALLWDGAGQIGDTANLGVTPHLNRATPFVVLPERTPPCLTAP